jgi:hypothetical protein
MRKALFAFALIFLSAFAVSAGTSSAMAKGAPVVNHQPQPREIYARDNGSTITIGTGKLIVIRLDEPRGRWNVTSVSGSAVKLYFGPQHVAQPDGIFTAPGTPPRFVVHYKGVQPGISTITIRSSKGVFVLHVQVD